MHANTRQPDDALHRMLTQAARALAFVLPDDELHELHDGTVRVIAGASRCRDLPAGPAIDTAFPASAFLIAPWRVLTAGHAVSFRDPRSLRLLFAHAAAPVTDADGAWFRFAPEHVAMVDHVEYLDTRPGHADVALLRLRPGPCGLNADIAPLAAEAALSPHMPVGMAAHPYGRACEFLRHDADGAAARITAADAHTLTARLTAWRGCSGAPWCTAEGVVGMQVRAHDDLAYAQRGLLDILRHASATN